MGDRKARLAALAARAGRSKPVATEEPVNDDTNEKSDNAQKLTVSFRNYAPHDDSLDPAEGGSPPKRPKKSETNEAAPTSALQEALQEAQEDASTSIKQRDEEIGSMSPKKINSDLKRDIQEKIAKLERRTQKAIVELLKARLEKEASEHANTDSDLD